MPLTKCGRCGTERWPYKSSDGWKTQPCPKCTQYHNKKFNNFYPKPATSEEYSKRVKHLKTGLNSKNLNKVVKYTTNNILKKQILHDKLHPNTFNPDGSLRLYALGKKKTSMKKKVIGSVSSCKPIDKYINRKWPNPDPDPDSRKKIIKSI